VSAGSIPSRVSGSSGAGLFSCFGAEPGEAERAAGVLTPPTKCPRMAQIITRRGNYRGVCCSPSDSVNLSALPGKGEKENQLTKVIGEARAARCSARVPPSDSRPSGPLSSILLGTPPSSKADYRPHGV
jgi:hypothetical protein